MSYGILLVVTPYPHGDPVKELLSEKFSTEEKAVKWLDRSFTTLAWKVPGIVKREKRKGPIRAVSIECAKLAETA